jgi:hypothetical protein
MGTPRRAKPQKGARKKVIAAAAEHEKTTMADTTSRFTKHTISRLLSSRVLCWSKVPSCEKDETVESECRWCVVE